jgi:hypothetical protein
MIRNKLNERKGSEERKTQNPVHFSGINLDQWTKNCKKERSRKEECN